MNEGYLKSRTPKSGQLETNNRLKLRKRSRPKPPSLKKSNILKKLSYQIGSTTTGETPNSQENDKIRHHFERINKHETPQELGGLNEQLTNEQERNSNCHQTPSKILKVVSNNALPCSSLNSPAPEVMDSNIIPNFWNTDNLNYQRIVLHPKFKARSLDRPKLKKESFPHKLGRACIRCTSWHKRKAKKLSNAGC